MDVPTAFLWENAVTDDVNKHSSRREERENVQLDTYPREHAY